jgi:C4-dicarboxylate-specific signal transduction histidine kinase
VISGLRALFTRREITFQQLSVESLVEGVVSLLRADARERMATIESIVEPDTPDVRGDRVHVSQVLINLFLNAMDAVADRPAGQRRVKVTARAVDPGCVEITVADSGSGIPEEVMNKIFEPFFTTKTGGMGMGLSVSRTIVEAHRGKLRAENGVAGGATFHVVLPAFESAPVS